jgi:protein phosphatase
MISVGFKTDKGNLRSGNEDSLFVMPAQQLYIVADGVGGHNSGELASRMAVGYMAQYVALNPLSAVTSKKELRTYFLRCFQGANELIHSKSLEEEVNNGMATTTVMCYLDGEDCYIINVGDSRAYLVREGVMRQLTEDHTLVQDMLRSGLLSKEEAMTHPDRNMITKAIGGEDAVEPDFYRFETCPGDVILLCTDGLYGEVRAERILQLASEYESMHQLAVKLVEEANEAGGKDNISVVCIRIGG